eukprot:6184761-Pleurochrysis_carterae.AAC.2
MGHLSWWDQGRMGKRIMLKATYQPHCLPADASNLSSRSLECFPIASKHLQAARDADDKRTIRCNADNQCNEPAR